MQNCESRVPASGSRSREHLCCLTRLRASWFGTGSCQVLTPAFTWTASHLGAVHFSLSRASGYISETHCIGVWHQEAQEWDQQWPGQGLRWCDQKSASLCYCLGSVLLHGASTWRSHLIHSIWIPYLPAHRQWCYPNQVETRPIFQSEALTEKLNVSSLHFYMQLDTLEDNLAIGLNILNKHPNQEYLYHLNQGGGVENKIMHMSSRLDKGGSLEVVYEC